MSVIRRTTSYILILSVYCLTWLLAVLGDIMPRRAWKPTGRIVVTGTFFNPNWYLSHLSPLVRSGIEEVILVVDEPQLPLKKVRFLCPPRWLSKLLGRAGAKAVWMLIGGLRHRPDLYMGYHLLPAGCTSLVVGRLLGRPSCYQMTGGPVEIIGGGYSAVDSFEGSLGRPSRLIEALALGVVRHFELVVVRGNSAREFLEAHGVSKSVAIVTGSTNHTLPLPRNHRNIHLIFVGRLTPVKQVHQFVAIVEAVRRVMPNVKAAIVGDGPLRKGLQASAGELGLAANIEFLGKRKDVADILSRSKIFVLTSKSEGLSIAMAEAMAAGVVPVVADIGELSDLVTDGQNGHLVESNCIDTYATKSVSLLRDAALWEKYSLRASEAARRHCDIEVVSNKWKKHLQHVIPQMQVRCRE
jgi:glycosyltransferase involved in cell wall biosynthesis